MIRTDDEKLLAQFRPMIRKHAHHWAGAYHVDYAEMEAQGLMIFARALRDFDATKAKFSTYLYGALRALEDHAKFLKRGYYHEEITKWEAPFDQDGNWAPTPLNNDDFQRLSTLPVEAFIDHLQRTEAQQLLSQDAQKLLQFITGMEWYNPEVPQKVTLVALQNGWFQYHTGWTKNHIQTVWRELRDWWQDPSQFIDSRMYLSSVAS